MISHKIVVFDEPFDFDFPPKLFSHNHVAHKAPLTQEDLDALLEQAPKVGDLLVSKIMAGSETLQEYSIHVVLYVEKDINKVNRTYTGEAEPLALCNLVDSFKPWCRWAALNEHVPLTDKQKEAVNVVLQNRIEKLLKYAKANAQS